jgi:hypothetical protein
VTTAAGPPAGPDGPPHVPIVTPSSSQKPSAGRESALRRWLPWAAIVAVVAIALGVILPLTIWSSSSNATPTPTTPSTSTTAGAVSGTYYTATVQDSSLMFLRLAETQTALAGDLTVTTAGPSHLRLVVHHYLVTGTVRGDTLSLTVVRARLNGSQSLKGTYASGVITIALASGTKVSLERGTLVMYRALVVRDRATLLA